MSLDWKSAGVTASKLAAYIRDKSENEMLYTLIAIAHASLDDAEEMRLAALGCILRATGVHLFGFEDSEEVRDGKA